MADIFNSVLRTIGQKPIIVMRTTSETAGVPEHGVPPVLHVHRHEVPGVLLPPTQERLAILGIELRGDAVLYVRDKLQLDDRILFEDVIYEITEEQKIPILYCDPAYIYLLSRSPQVQTDTAGDDAHAPGFALILEPFDDFDIVDEANLVLTEIPDLTLGITDTFEIGEAYYSEAIS